jgi:hypothetical protein
MLGIWIPVRLDQVLLVRFGPWKSYGSSQSIGLRVVAKSARSEKPDFTFMNAARLWTVALKQPIFKRKNVFVNFWLGINYCSIGPSRPPSRDTVPLALRDNQINLKTLQQALLFETPHRSTCIFHKIVAHENVPLKFRVPTNQSTNTSCSANHRGPLYWEIWSRLCTKCWKNVLSPS